jgi:DNA-binding NarL/FixJ family response regulator
VIRQGATIRPPRPGDPLTKRELQVAAMLLDGKVDKEIAAELVIAVRTAKFHTSRIIIKLGCCNRTGATVKFARMLDARARAR